MAPDLSASGLIIRRNAPMPSAPEVFDAAPAAFAAPTDGFGAPGFGSPGVGAARPLAVGQFGT